MTTELYGELDVSREIKFQVYFAVQHYCLGDVPDEIIRLSYAVQDSLEEALVTPEVRQLACTLLNELRKPRTTLFAVTSRS